MSSGGAWVRSATAEVAAASGAPRESRGNAGRGWGATAAGWEGGLGLGAMRGAFEGGDGWGHCYCFGDVLSIIKLTTRRIASWGGRMIKPISSWKFGRASTQFENAGTIVMMTNAGRLLKFDEMLS